jgi:hypothetical protein
MKGLWPTRDCYPMEKMPNTTSTYFINQCPSPCTRKRKTNFRQLDLFRSSHEKYVISLCLIEWVILVPLPGVLAVRQSQDTLSELLQGYWNWMFFISFSFNGAKNKRIYCTHILNYMVSFLILSFILTDRMNFTLLLYLKFSGVEEIFVFMAILKCKGLDPISV